MSSAYAIIKSGGKQHRVKVGLRLKLEKLPGEPGDTISLDEVLLVSDNGKTQVGDPLVAKASVKAQILSQTRDDKITVIKFKRRKKYRRKQGHRQSITRVKITEIHAA